MLGSRDGHGFRPHWPGLFFHQLEVTQKVLQAISRARYYESSLHFHTTYASCNILCTPSIKVHSHHMAADNKPLSSLVLEAFISLVDGGSPN